MNIWIYRTPTYRDYPFNVSNLTNLKHFSIGGSLCLSDDPGIQQWAAKHNLTFSLYECLPPIESLPPKTDLIHQLNNLGWFSLYFENTSDFKHWQIYAIFEAVQKWNDVILGWEDNGFGFQYPLPMEITITRSQEPYSVQPTVWATASYGGLGSIEFYPSVFQALDDYTAGKFPLFKDLMVHEIGHLLV